MASRTRHNDIVRAIRKLKCLIPVKVVFEHVLGHQDDHSSFVDLPLMSQLNIRCDEMAKQALVYYTNNGTVTSPRIFAEGWQCWVDGVKQTTDPSDAIRASIFSDMMRNKLHAKNALPAPFFDLVDWDAVEDAQAYYPNGFSLWMSKQVTGFCGVGKMMCRWGHWNTNQCPCCDAEIETAQHILVCTDPEMTDEFRECVEVLETWFIDKDTCPEIADCIITAIARHKPTAFGLSADSLVEEAANQQDQIGWTNLLEGKISKLWRALQSTYLQELGSRNTARTWAHGLIRQLLEFTHRMWLKRNHIRHKRAAEDGSPMDEESLDLQVQEQHEWGTFGLAAADHGLLTELSLTEVQKLGLIQKQAWLLNINAARKAEDMRARRALGNMQNFMNEWLAPAVTNENPPPDMGEAIT